MVDGTTILLVEDNPLMRETLCDILQVFHPEWRVQAAQRNRPDLIVLDFHMPVMNGYEMALSLQAQPETRQIPLILNTTEDQNHPLVKRLQSMCNAVLNKPFSLSDLDHVLSAVLNQRAFAVTRDHVPSLQTAMA